jgi:hypothetical protein
MYRYLRWIALVYLFNRISQGSAIKVLTHSFFVSSTLTTYASMLQRRQCHEYRATSPSQAFYDHENHHRHCCPPATTNRASLASQTQLARGAAQRKLILMQWIRVNCEFATQWEQWCKNHMYINSSPLQQDHVIPVAKLTSVCIRGYRQPAITHVGTDEIWGSAPQALALEQCLHHNITAIASSDMPHDPLLSSGPQWQGHELWRLAKYALGLKKYVI